MTLTTNLLLVCALLNVAAAAPPDDPPEVIRISPTSGPEGSRVEVVGKNLQDTTAVMFGTSSGTFKLISPEKLIAIVPYKAATSAIVVVTSRMPASSPFPFVVSNDARVPEEVSYKSGYVNPVPMPPGFTAVLLWGIAIADTRIPDYQSANVEITWTELSCRADGTDIVLNDDRGKVRGGLYQRNPWFGNDQHQRMPLAYDDAEHAVVLRVGQRADRVWHFWSASGRAALPSGKLAGCTVKVEVKISSGALLQVGMDYWRNLDVQYGNGGNNHEAGAGNWYFPSERWQEAVFTDIGGPQF